MTWMINATCPRNKILSTRTQGLNFAKDGEATQFFWELNREHLRCKWMFSLYSTPYFSGSTMLPVGNKMNNVLSVNSVVVEIVVRSMGSPFDSPWQKILFLDSQYKSKLFLDLGHDDFYLVSQIRLPFCLLMCTKTLHCHSSKRHTINSPSYRKHKV